MWIVSDYMKVVVIKNLTNEPLTNIIISHDGEGSNKFKIKKLPPNSFQEASLYILRAKESNSWKIASLTKMKTLL